LQDQIRARIARQEKSNLPPQERRMLGDARTFLSQSEGALAASDFQRARTLTRKASMLLAVIEQQ
jgi:RNA polymerase-interacting CarD/CdnL/TRCF family regulator